MAGNTLAETISEGAILPENTLAETLLAATLLAGNTLAVKTLEGDRPHRKTIR
ncbi:hypothetical protein HPC62_02110 [Thermoleptolyngbya sichuanensis A183]|uniref:Uncharacterized protein n=1 Tax=Thermoleptolyngbya sichuanensis A183 TaxID=2737172 RepID=A0A6M8B431_9CYAN|nr:MULTISPECIES: hypothetical protein [Thermoleptolyngbya]QKD81128.1 hypothetical protein HPC62_02110 [Thermoleptolyngbya sichuanensis A183]